jgi:hypothetical protein
MVAVAEHLTAGSIDAVSEPLEDGYMATIAPTSPRRSGRVFHKMRLQAKGRAHDGRKFSEKCETVVVSTHGALVLLKHEIDTGETLVLVHPETLEEQECRVVYQGDPGDRGQRIGIEFLTPAPHFWELDLEEKPAMSDDGSAHR